MQKSHLRVFREQVGLSVRELAATIGTHHTNLSYWERTGRVGKTEFIEPLASALGVSIEDILGLERKQRGNAPGGRLGRSFEAASKLPRRQQQKIAEVVEGMLLLHETKAG